MNKRTKNDNKGIKGIAFIVDDSDKGPKLVFRYPTTFLPNRSTSSLRGGLTSNVLERPITKQTVAQIWTEVTTLSVARRVQCALTTRCFARDKVAFGSTTTFIT